MDNTLIFCDFMRRGVELDERKIVQTLLGHREIKQAFKVGRLWFWEREGERAEGIGRC